MLQGTRYEPLAHSHKVSHMCCTTHLARSIAFKCPFPNPFLSNFKQNNKQETMILYLGPPLCAILVNFIENLKVLFFFRDELQPIMGQFDPDNEREKKE